MATWSRLGASFRGIVRNVASHRSVWYGGTIGAGVLGYVLSSGFIRQNYQPQYKFWPHIVYAEEAKSMETENPVLTMSTRRLRFNQFASVVYDQEPYMTPRDFLHSILLEEVDRKLHKKILSKTDVEEMLKVASKAEAGNYLFRRIGDKGMISYTEYLFLLTILTKPETGFHIAFKMLDVDGNEHVDKKEFQKLKKIIGPRKALKKEGTEASNSADEANTTLQVFFFGKNGLKRLHYTDFCRFMEDLQAEVQEMEFLQFSKGMGTMRREDFAEWLLHYTNEEDNEAYWENMRKRIPAGQSITFDEFKEFCLFTYHLEDFAFSIKMISDANKPIGMAQFKRAVKIATGHDLSDNVLDTVFETFDLDGDNCLSHKEFLAVMKDRVLRGLRVKSQSDFSGYWKCVKKETLQGAKEALRQSGSPV